MLWIILVAGIDTGISISGANYYDALKGAMDLCAERRFFVDQNDVDVIKLEWAQ